MLVDRRGAAAADSSTQQQGGGRRGFKRLYLASRRWADWAVQQRAAGCQVSRRCGGRFSFIYFDELFILK